MSFNCSVCGERHEAELRDTRFSYPDVVFELTTEERARRVWSADDWCVLDGESDEARRFVRGLLKLPLLEEEGYFGYGVWVEVAQSDFGVLVEHWSILTAGSSRPSPDGSRTSSDRTEEPSVWTWSSRWPIPRCSPMSPSASARMR